MAPVAGARPCPGTGRRPPTPSGVVRQAGAYGVLPCRTNRRAGRDGP